jgi:hypothetical protein
LRGCDKRKAAAVDDDHHLTQKQLAFRWRISQRTLEAWRWRGEGPPYLKIGGRCIYRWQDVKAFEAARLRKRTSEVAMPDEPALCVSNKEG